MKNDNKTIGTGVTFRNLSKHVIQNIASRTITVAVSVAFPFSILYDSLLELKALFAKLCFEPANRKLKLKIENKSDKHTCGTILSNASKPMLWL